MDYDLFLQSQLSELFFDAYTDPLGIDVDFQLSGLQMFWYFYFEVGEIWVFVLP